MSQSSSPEHLPEGLLCYPQAAKFLGISLRQFRRLVDGGLIAFVQISPRTPRVRLSVLRAYIESVTIQRPQQIAA